MEEKKIIFVANTSWFIYNFQMNLIREFQIRGFSVTALAPEDEYSNKLIQNGVLYKNINLGRKSLNPLRDIKLLFQLINIYSNEKADYIFHTTIKPVIYGSIAARIVKSKNVFNMISGLGSVFIGNTNKERLLRRLVKTLYSMALRYSRKIFFQNPDDKKYFVDKLSIDSSKVVVTNGLGVDLERFYFVKPGEKSSECIFLFVGRILWDKGIGEYIEAGKIVKAKNHNARFQILGKIDKDNPSHVDAHTLKEWIDQGIIEYLGESDDVRKQLVNAGVVVLPSYREGIPSSLLEAMSMGKTIIATNVPGCKETVVNGSNGFLVPVKNANALSEAMFCMINNPEQRISMGYESRRIVEERFDVKIVNSTILKSMGIS